MKDWKMENYKIKKCRVNISTLQFSIIPFLLFLCLPVFKTFGQNQSGISNPVLPGVADAGAIKFNGEYYIGGVFTNGSFYTSQDLIHWEGPVHVFSMDNEWTEGASADDSRIHANDINYVNGIFHMYWSVNYWGKDKHVVHIGHATSPDVLGPYKEPVKDTWLANRIDPHLFVDDDGKFYLYMVKFTDGNTIWVRPMKDPWTFSGEPRYLFASLPGTWETLDNRVAEGPWVIKYRDRYYMMYNTNHTSTHWGNYTLGVAEADSPVGFHHGSKYPWPVVKSNQIDLEDRFVDLLKYTGDPAVFLYTSDQPDKSWNKAEFDAASWQKGKPGFGSRVIKNSTTRHVSTQWTTPEIWVRKRFVADENTGNLMLRIHHDGPTKVWLNGKVIYEHEGRQYITWDFDKHATSLLKEGENILAIHSTKGTRGNFLDVSLFDMKGQQTDDILYSPGQPNILRGPNGFEWWLVYMANKNAERRGQFINRVHFFGKTLFVDGVTSDNTAGYHPQPAQPTFITLFNEGDNSRWQNKWQVSGGTWDLRNKKVVQTGSEPASAMVKSQQAAHYLFEAGVKMSEQGSKAGVYACWQDENNWLKVMLDRQNKSWGYITKTDGQTEVFSFPLPADFNYNAYHKLRIYKNAADFTIRIDNKPAPQSPVIKVAEFSGEGIPGLFTEGENTSFDGVIYTIGWDEFDEQVAGWGNSAAGSPQKGSWLVSDEGLSQTEASGENIIFKGDMLEAYEISVQVSTEDGDGSAGLYPVYIDDDNYLKAAFDFKKQKLIISGKRKGKAVEQKEIPLARRQSYYADMKYTDFIEKRFTLHAPAVIDGLKISKTPHNRPDTVIEDLYKRMHIFYKQENKWYPLKTWKEVPSFHPGFDQITFPPVKAEALRFVNKEAEDHHFYTYKIWVNEIFKQAYNLRVAKRENAVIFLVDGEEVLRIKNDFPASQVGLFSENTEANFNGITLFHLNTPEL